MIGHRRTIIFAQPVAVVAALLFTVVTDIVLIGLLCLVAGFLSAVDRLGDRHQRWSLHVKRPQTLAEELSMAKFVVEFVYNVNRAERQAVHPEHSAYLNHLAECGMLLLAGPLVDENGALMIYEVADRAELRKVLDAEPYVRAGFVAESRIHQWEPCKGSWATTFVTV